LAVFGLMAGAAAPVSGQLSGSKDRKAEVSLHASVDAIVPGEPFELAFKFKMSPGWHIYWQNPGDAGLPPSVKWTMPEGFEAGRFQFPKPSRHVDAANLVTNILEGEPILLMRMTPPKRIDQDRVMLKAKVNYLVCKDVCLIENAELALELPVASTNEPANEEIFGTARAAIPKPTSKWLKVTAKPTTETFQANTAFELLVEIALNHGIHIQADRVLNKLQIPTHLLLERTPGVTFEEPVFPKAQVRQLPYVGRVAEFEGKVVVQVPAKVGDEALKGPVDFGGLLTYQACNEAGTCFPPETVAFSVTVGSTGNEQAAALSPEETEDAAAAGSPGEMKDVTGESADAGDSEQAKGATSTEGEPEAVTTTADSPVKGQTDQASLQVGGFETFLKRLGLPGLLIGCFLYGLAMNVTPCVLPILSIKVLGFVQQAHESRRRTLALGLAFGAGVMIFFIILGFIASEGKNVLQYPAAVIALNAIILALSLSMLGVYTLQVPAAATRLEASIKKEGLLSSFGKGALAPVLGFACTGPLLAGIFGWAAQQPPSTALVAFLVTGFGMASPYVLLGANPNWLNWLPKPGNWMITFERIMGFLLLVMVVYLLDPLVGQIGAEGLQWTLAFLVVVAMGCWLWGKVDLSMPAPVRWRYRGGAVAIIALAGLLIYGGVYPIGAAVERQERVRLGTKGGEGVADGIPWKAWSPKKVSEAVKSGKTVFVDVTADYCTNCKTNKAVAINTQETLEKIKSLGVETFQADFSGGDPVIFQLLKKYNRLGPPLNLVYLPGKPDEPIVLPPLFSKTTLLEKLDEAGPSKS
jgi:thiol:disulfide interchange protein